MANLSRIKTWNSGEILTHTDLNAEFQNILDNASTLVSTITALTISNDPGVLIISNSDVSINDDDQIGRIDFRAYVGDGTGSGSSHNINARIHVVADDVTGATEDATVTFQGIVAGTLTTMFSYGANIMTIQPDLEAASAILRLVSDQNDDAGDGWEFKVTNGGVLTLGNDIASAGSYVAHLTMTPNSTLAASIVAFPGLTTFAADSTFTGDILSNASASTSLGSASAELSNVFIADDSFINLGNDQDVLIGYNTTRAGLDIKATEGAALAVFLSADEGDDAGDEWKLNVADAGVITLGNDIASAGTHVTHLTFTPHATVTSSTAAFGGIVTANAFEGNITGNVTGNASGTALTVTQAAQTAITSVGTLTGLALSGTFTQDKGADVASTAGVMTLGADGNYFDITGTNSITGIATLGVGTFVTLHFDAAATLVHHSTDLIMPGAANVVCAAGDEFTFVEFATADWRCVSYALASGKAIVASVAATVTITDNESTDESNAIIFTAGGDVDGGDLGLESDGTLTYNPSTGKVTATGFVGSGDSITGIESYSPRGLICSMDTDADHDVAISVGGVKDATNTVNMTLAAILTKRIDSPWTVGDNNGGIKVASGGVLANTMYYIWLIKRSDTGVVDALFSLSATDPTLPTNYDYERLIGSVLTNSSSTIVSFTQSGDYFQYLEFDSGGPVNDIADASVTTSYETGTLSVPPLCIAHIYGYSYNPAMTGSSLHLWLKTKGQTLAFAGSDSWLVVDSSVAMDTTGREGVIKVDASREVEYTAYYDEDGGSPAASVSISTFGFWMLTRSNP